MTPPPTAASTARVRAATAVPAPLRLPPAPRRVSGPARRERVSERPRHGASALLIGLIDHPWLERLIRGRAWIAIVATALLGIVAMQVALLRFGAQIGGETAAVNSMQERNNSIQATIAAIEASRGIGTAVSSLGMVYPPPGAVSYLQPNPGDARLAADRLQSPSAAAIAAAAAQLRRASTHASVATPPASTVVNTGATGAATGATGGAATGTPAGTPTAGTANANAVSTNAAGAPVTTTNGAAATVSPTSGTAATPPTTTATTTSPATSLTGGASAPTGTTSAAGATGG